MLCVCPLLYVPPAALKLVLKAWSLFPWDLGIFFFSSFRILPETHLNLNKRNLPFMFLVIHPSTFHWLISSLPLRLLLCDLSPTDMRRYPHSCFISTVCSSRSLRLQFCAGTVPLCESPAGNACQHRWKWWWRGEYLIHVVGGDWDTPQPRSTYFISFLQFQTMKP